VGEETLWERFTGWVEYLPVLIAYRIIWLAAVLGSPTARLVYKAMWSANLDLPPIKGLADDGE
jgi:hypothetical protein